MSSPPLSPDLRRLLIAQLPADFADWLDFVAIGALLAYVWQVDPFVFAILAVSMGLPYLLVGPFAGVLVDRLNTRQVLILSNLGRGLVTAALFLAPHWGVLMVMVALRSSVDTFFTPAKQSAIQMLTTADNRMAANGYSHAINQASKIVAPALGGALLIWLSPHAVFLMNAFVSLVAAALVLRVTNITKPMPTGDDAGMLQNIREGLRDIQTSTVLRAALMMMAAGYFAMFIYDTLIAPMTRDLGFPETILGLSLAAVGAGGVIGSLVLGTGSTKSRPFAVIAGESLVASIAIGGIGLAEAAGFGLHVALYISLFGVLGLASAMAMVPFRTVLQNNAAPDRIGRITALSEAANTIALLTAPFIGAAIASASSIGFAFICGAAVMFCVAVGGWRLRDVT